MKTFITVIIVFVSLLTITEMASAQNVIFHPTIKGVKNQSINLQDKGFCFLVKVRTHSKSQSCGCEVNKIARSWRLYMYTDKSGKSVCECQAACTEK
jgi:hypothetical protein